MRFHNSLQDLNFLYETEIIDLTMKSVTPLNVARHMSSRYQSELWEIYTHLIGLCMNEVSIEGYCD